MRPHVPTLSGLGRLVRLACLWLLAMAVVGGCAPIHPAGSMKPSSNALPTARLAPDAVVMDLAFASLRGAEADAYSNIWNAADEQPLTPELRRSLATNGLRVGIFGQQLPEELRTLLDAKPRLLESISQGNAEELELDGGRQHMPLRAGHRSIVKVSNVFENLPVLISEDGAVRGQQLKDARCIFSLKAHPLGDGRVKVVLTPEIEHGESKTRWMGSEGMMIQQTGQERLVLDRLQWEVVLRPGESMLVSGTPDHRGLGEYFFSQNTGGNPHRRLLVLRFAQTQFDDLFTREQTSAPLTTPVE